ncbi:hypothetical protein ACIREE_05410 [Streptomyces sp. NPDC102467]|uniref:hypothetical protein n=1 Tax=Streptomyces sp. NPDC102467 TaxID=3366179 RepID=UPI003829D2E3
MHAIRAASAAVLSLTALALAAPLAAAGDSESFQAGVTPRTIAAGGQVTLNVSGCAKKTTVSSGIFDTTTIGKGSGSQTRTVDWDAKQGAIYSVTFACKHGATRNVDLTIAGGRPEHSVAPNPPPVDHGVRAGVGGSIAGFDLQEIGLGAALITGALGGAYYLVRRRTADDNT